MPGTITFRPIEANLTHNTDIIGRMNPYCAFIVGDSIFKGQVCKKGGKHPHWDDAVTIPVGNQSQVIVELFDKDRFSRDDNIGSFLLNLNELQGSGTSSRWYPLTYKNKPAGEILLEATFSGQGLGQSGYQQGGFQQSNLQQGGLGVVGGNLSQGETSTLNQGFIEQTTSQPLVQEEIITVQQPVVVEQEIIKQQVPVPERHFYQEQQQVIEERRFLKEVDVVQTQAHLQTIETLEPTKVMREVQYTQITPVTHQIEIMEPHVVQREVEVIEPRLVTKTIQVVENVPVMKMVDVIENIPRIEEVTSYEPQTFTKQVEVTDYVPVQRQVTVTEPVHIKQSVEFVEPVITTKTITKEVQQPVIVDEQTTTSVGPASIIGESSFYCEFSKLSISGNDRLSRYNEWNRMRQSGYNDQQLDQHFQQKGWGPVNQYKFHEFHQGGYQQSNLGSQYSGSNQYSNQYSGSNLQSGTSQFSSNDRMTRFKEWLRLKTHSGYNDQQLDQHFQQQGWGTTSQYRFYELEQQGLHGPHTSSTPLSQKF